MKILFLTNFYPPASRGGYEQWCQEVAHRLKNRGHDVLILTSTHGRNSLQSPDPEWVRRILHLEMEIASIRNSIQFFASRKKREKENWTLLQQTIEGHAPDAILIWGMWNLPRSLPALAEKLMPGKIAYYMGDYWPTLPSQFENYWNAPPRNFFTGLPKSFLKPVAQRILANEEKPALLLDRVIFPSAFMRDEFICKGITPKDTEVIYGAIETSPYRDLEKKSKQNDKISLLYIGRLTHEKGVHTAIKALAHLVDQHGLKNLKLTIVGDGDPDYVEHLQQLVEQKKITPFVTFMPAQPKETLPAFYHQSDIFLFTSIWAEPFGRVIVEAMAAGVAVVGTAVGGASEILIENENALIFTPDDPASLSRQLKQLIETPSLRRQLANAGRQIAVDKFDIKRMTTEIEAYLKTLSN